MPAPVILLAVLMIGYPLVQILAIRLRRPKRLRFNAVIGEVMADERLGHDDRNVVRRIDDASRGGLSTLKVLLWVPITAFASAFEGDGSGRGPTSDNDLAEKIEWLRDQSIGLEMATHPIGTAIAVPIAFAAWALGACVALLKGAATPSLPSFRSVLRAATSPGALPLVSRT